MNGVVGSPGRHGQADVGGTGGWGAPAPPGDEPVFARAWQGRVFALGAMAGRLSGTTLPEFRYALERLSPDAYGGDGYYGRWLYGTELLLVEAGVLAAGAVRARAAGVLAAGVLGAPVGAPEPAYPAGGRGSLRTVARARRFSVGDRVRAAGRDGAPPQAPTRLPGYLFGCVGTVGALRPAAVLPDTDARRLGEHPEHVYAVGFRSVDVYGSAAEDFTVTADLYESYLRPADDRVPADG